MKNTFEISGIIIFVCLNHSCENNLSIPRVPTVPYVLTNLYEFSQTTATSGGEVLSEGGAPIISRGVCWSTSANPTIENSKKTETGRSGSFTSYIDQLTPNTLYYVRAYATNRAGTGYGETRSFTTLISVIDFNPGLTYDTVTDIDNNVYKTISIGIQPFLVASVSAQLSTSSATVVTGGQLQKKMQNMPGGVVI